MAVEGKVAASTQNQALAACLFLYREVLGIDLLWLDNVTRAKVSQRVPCVLSVTEVRALFAQMRGRTRLIAELLYGSGMRLMECLRLRVKDLDFQRLEITVRDGKGGKDRRTILPEKLIDALRVELESVRMLHQQDLASDAFSGVYLPFALARKYPAAARELCWAYCFRRSASVSIRWIS